MTATLGIGTGSQFGEFKKEQAFTYTSPAFGIGSGPRSDPNKFNPNWTPAPGVYKVDKDGSQNEGPKFK